MKEAVALPFPFFLAIFISLFLAVFYNTVTNMAGPYIVSELGGSREISIYAMVFFGLGNLLGIPLASQLAKRWGTIRVLVCGLVVYTCCSICCGLASTFVLFNIYRIGLGVAAGLFYILSRKLIIQWAPQEKIPAYTFVMLLMYVTGPVIGACVGAWIAYESHWRWIFYGNEIFALGIATYLWLCFRRLDVCTKAETFQIDKVGYLFFTLGISTLVTAATLSQQLDWYRSSVFLTLIVIGIPCFLFFILWCWNHPEPILKIRLFSSLSLCYALLNLALLFSAYFGMIILIPLWLNIYANYTVIWIAAILGVMVVSALLAYGMLRTPLKKVDPRWMLALAIGCFTASCYYSTHFNIEVDFFHLAVARILDGSALVLFFIPLFNMTLNSYGKEESLNLFTLFQVVRALSSSLGAILYVIVWQRRQSFFHERLGETLTPGATLTRNYFHDAEQQFHLTGAQATEQLDIFLNQQATSLALNDALGCMGYICLSMLVLLIVMSWLKKLPMKWT